MSPSNGAEMADDTFSDFSPTFDRYYPDINSLPSLGDSNSIGSPSMYLFPEELYLAANGSDDATGAKHLETGIAATTSQTGTPEARASDAAAVIPLTVLELDTDDAANTSPEAASSATNDVLFKSHPGPNKSKRVRRDVCHSVQSPLSLSEGPKVTKVTHFSVTSPPKGTLLFGGIGDSEKVTSHSVVNQVNDMNAPADPWLWKAGVGKIPVRNEHYHCGNSGHQRATKPTTEAASSSEVPVAKLERRREQNRKAAYRCRNKRKQQEDQLMKDFELTTKDNRQKRQEIQDLMSQIERLQMALQRHTTTDHCYVQAPQLHAS